MIDAIIDKYGFMEGLTIRDDEIIEWPYDVPIPSRQELQAILAKYENSKEAKAKKAKQEMPSIDEQLDDLYKAMDAGNLPNDNEFYRKRKAVYDKYGVNNG